MARPRIMSIAKMNVEMDTPHSPARYVQLLKTAYKLFRDIKVRGDDRFIFTNMEIKGDHILGTIGKFTHIDFNKNWLNLSAMKSADKNDMSKVIIPSNLRPNYEPFYFYFYPKKHLFIYEKNSSPKIVRKFLDTLFSDKEIVDEFGYINVSIIQSKEGLNEVLRLDKILELEMKIRRPNPDDNGSLDEEVMKAMEESGSSELDFKLKGSRTSGVIVTPAIRKLGEAALKHGQIDSRGLQGNKVVSLSSEDHADIDRIDYDPNVSSDRDAFQGAARKIINS